MIKRTWCFITLLSQAVLLAEARWTTFASSRLLDHPSIGAYMPPRLAMVNATGSSFDITPNGYETHSQTSYEPLQRTMSCMAARPATGGIVVVFGADSSGMVPAQRGSLPFEWRSSDEAGWWRSIWSSADTFPQDRYGAACSSANSYLFVFGGRGPATSSDSILLLDDLWQLSFERQLWIPLHPRTSTASNTIILPPLFGSSAMFLPDFGCLALWGGIGNTTANQLTSSSRSLLSKSIFRQRSIDDTRSRQLLASASSGNGRTTSIAGLSFICGLPFASLLLSKENTSIANVDVIVTNSSSSLINGYLNYTTVTTCNSSSDSGTLNTTSSEGQLPLCDRSCIFDSSVIGNVNPLDPFGVSNGTLGAVSTHLTLPWYGSGDVSILVDSSANVVAVQCLSCRNWLSNTTSIVELSLTANDTTNFTANLTPSTVDAECRIAASNTSAPANITLTAVTAILHLYHDALTPPPTLHSGLSYNVSTGRLCVIGGLTPSAMPDTTSKALPLDTRWMAASNVYCMQLQAWLTWRLQQADIDPNILVSYSAKAQRLLSLSEADSDLHRTDRRLPGVVPIPGVPYPTHFPTPAPSPAPIPLWRQLQPITIASSSSSSVSIGASWLNSGILPGLTSVTMHMKEDGYDRMMKIVLLQNYSTGVSSGGAVQLPDSLCPLAATTSTSPALISPSFPLSQSAIASGMPSYVNSRHHPAYDGADVVTFFGSAMASTSTCTSSADAFSPSTYVTSYSSNITLLVIPPLATSDFQNTQPILIPACGDHDSVAAQLIWTVYSTSPEAIYATPSASLLTNPYFWGILGLFLFVVSWCIIWKQVTSPRSWCRQMSSRLGLTHQNRRSSESSTLSETDQSILQTWAVFLEHRMMDPDVDDYEERNGLDPTVVMRLPRVIYQGPHAHHSLQEVFSPLTVVVKSPAMQSEGAVNAASQQAPSRAASDNQALPANDVTVSPLDIEQTVAKQLTSSTSAVTTTEPASTTTGRDVVQLQPSAFGATIPDAKEESNYCTSASQAPTAETSAATPSTSSPAPSASTSATSPVRSSTGYTSSQSSCPVCLEEYHIGEELTELPCGHRYHPCCIATWLFDHFTCPVCKYYILPITPSAPEDGTTGGADADDPRLQVTRAIPHATAATGATTVATRHVNSSQMTPASSRISQPVNPSGPVTNAHHTASAVLAPVEAGDIGADDGATAMHRRADSSQQAPPQAGGGGGGRSGGGGRDTNVTSPAGSSYRFWL